jgi:hypothetical protein
VRFHTAVPIALPRPFCPPTNPPSPQGLPPPPELLCPKEQRNESVYHKDQGQKQFFFVISVFFVVERVSQVFAAQCLNHVFEKITVFIQILQKIS